MSLAQALAAQKTSPTPGHYAGAASASPSGFAPGGGGGPKRDEDGAVYVTAKQAAGYLPPGRYKVRHANGFRTIEVGSSACSLGRSLVLERKRVQAAAKRLERETMVQDDLFGEIRR
jgi:hypothetical protein